jgi:hypothetical protein
LSSLFVFFFVFFGDGGAPRGGIANFIFQQVTGLIFT